MNELDFLVNKPQKKKPLERKKFNPREKLHSIEAQKMQNEIKDGFNLKPKRDKYCPNHPRTPIEYYCQIFNEFYCRICIPEFHADHKEDVPLSTVQHEVQMALTKLKHKYLIKRTHIMDRLVDH